MVDVLDVVTCPVKGCGASGDEHCSTRSGKNHPSRDAAIAYHRLCKAEHTIGSYPDDETLPCQLDGGHAGPHQYVYEWDNRTSPPRGGATVSATTCGLEQCPDCEQGVLRSSDYCERCDATGRVKYRTPEGAK